MAANDEFPRGPTLSNQSSGGQASVTFPAVPGLSWVLTDIDAIAASGSTGNYAFSVVTSIAPSAPIGFVSFGVGSAVQSSDEWTWSGQLCAPIGELLIVEFSAASAVVVQTLNVSAYLI